MCWRGEHVVLGYSPTGVVVFVVSLDPDGRLTYEPVAKAVPVLSPEPAVA